VTLADDLARFDIDAATLPKLEAFVPLFETWNERINLSAARTRDEIESHIVDSLAVVPHVRGATRVIDVGSGGGFPVVIAAACLPGTQFVALEPVHKKHAWLRTAARTLGLANLDAYAERVESHAVHDYDVAMSRATFELSDWLACGLTLVRPGGLVIGFEAIPRELEVEVTRVPYQLADKSRALVLLRASAST
jgi:16S rRNA (guanine527-N7)-methyltransferase